MFVDDTNLFMPGRNIDTLFSSVNKELKYVTEWFQANRLSLNVKKTKYSLFHPAQKKRKLPTQFPILSFNDEEISRDPVTRFLGVLIDENLNWKSLLYKTRQILDKTCLKQLYHSFINSYLPYANVV